MLARQTRRLGWSCSHAQIRTLRPIRSDSDTGTQTRRLGCSDSVTRRLRIGHSDGQTQTRRLRSLKVGCSKSVARMLSHSDSETRMVMQFMPRFGRADPFAQTQTLVLRLGGSDARTRSLGGSGSDTRMIRLGRSDGHTHTRRLGGSGAQTWRLRLEAQTRSLGYSDTEA